MSETAKIIAAAQAINEREKVLHWLESYGVALTGRPDSDDAAVTVHLNWASSCPGAKEAAALLSSCASLDLPKIVASAIQCCKNDIEIHREQIIEATKATGGSNA